MIHKEDRTKNMYNAVAYEENNKEQCYFCDCVEFKYCFSNQLIELTSLKNLIYTFNVRRGKREEC